MLFVSLESYILDWISYHVYTFLVFSSLVLGTWDNWKYTGSLGFIFFIFSLRFDLELSTYHDDDAEEKEDITTLRDN